MATSTPDKTREKRAMEIENALASVRMEGIEPSDEAKAIFQRYVDGDLTSSQMGHAIDQLLGRKYGSLRPTESGAGAV